MENTNFAVVVNPACEELTGKIKGSMYNIAKEFVYIGFLLAECDYFQYYRDWGYSSIHEYASHQLGFKKSSTYNFINVCKTFCQPSTGLPFSYLIKEPYSRFNFSQLVEMLSMNDKQCSQVTPDMTVKQIRVVKNSFSEPEYAKLYNMQLNFEEFSEVYSRKINGKKFTLKIKGRKCEPSDIWPDGYYLSIDVDLYMDCGHSFGYNRIADYAKFKELVFNQWYIYDKVDDSRRLEDDSAAEASADTDDLSLKKHYTGTNKVNEQNSFNFFDELEDLYLSFADSDKSLFDCAKELFDKYSYYLSQDVYVYK